MKFSLKIYSSKNKQKSSKKNKEKLIKSSIKVCNLKFHLLFKHHFYTLECWHFKSVSFLIFVCLYSIIETPKLSNRDIDYQLPKSSKLNNSFNQKRLGK